MSHVMLRRFAWLWLLLAVAPAQASTVPYNIDARYATIEFTTSGLFATQGYFQKFTGNLALDFAAPEHSSVSVTVDDSAIVMSWPPGVQMLKSASYFDSAAYPHIRFRSTSITPGANPGQYVMEGELTIRGITKPQKMIATLLSAPAGGTNAGTADFYVTGTLHRSDFGMVADKAAVDDAVVLKIHARVIEQK